MYKYNSKVTSYYGGNPIQGKISSLQLSTHPPLATVLPAAANSAHTKNPQRGN